MTPLESQGATERHGATSPEHDGDALVGAGRRPGCLRGVVGFVALAVLAPFAVLAKNVARWRRGSKVRLDWTEATLPDSEGHHLHRFDLEADVPHGRAVGFRTALTDTVVRIAEAMRRPDDVYHHTVRLAELEETTTVPVGPQFQELGERFALVLAQGALEGRTSVWLTLPRHHAVAEVLDPFGYDPEAAGEPERLLTLSVVRWGMASSHLATGPSAVHRMLFYVPASGRAAVENLLERLRERTR